MGIRAVSVLGIKGINFLVYVPGGPDGDELQAVINSLMLCRLGHTPSNGPPAVS